MEVNLIEIFDYDPTDFIKGDDILRQRSYFFGEEFGRHSVAIASTTGYTSIFLCSKKLTLMLQK